MQKINLVAINKHSNHTPSVFDDSINACMYLLTQAGYEATRSVNYIDPQDLNIIWGAGCHFSHSFDEIAQVAKPENCIIFNMEQLGSSSELVTPQYLKFLSQYRVFDYNIKNIETLKQHFSDAQAIEFPIVPTPNLIEDIAIDSIDFDIGFYGAMVPRRAAILKQLIEAGISIKLIQGEYGPSLSKVLANCKIVLNIHAYETRAFESARCLRPLAMGIPVVSEMSDLPESVNWKQTGVVFAEENQLIGTVQNVLANYLLQIKLAREAVNFTHQKFYVDLIKKLLKP